MGAPGVGRWTKGRRGLVGVRQREEEYDGYISGDMKEKKKKEETKRDDDARGRKERVNIVRRRGEGRWRASRERESPTPPVEHYYTFN